MKIDDPDALSIFRGHGRCDFCCRLVKAREPFHIIAAGLGSGSRIDHPLNVLSACSAFSGGDNCHRKWHDGNLMVNGLKVSMADCFDLVAKRDGLGSRDVQEAVRYFWNLSPKLNETEIERRVVRLRPGTGKLVVVLLQAREKSLEAA